MASHRFQSELPTVVEAAIGVELTAPWIAPLRRAASGAPSMKWAHVEDFVLNGSSGDAGSVRDGLGSQMLVVTDPMRAVRSFDLTSAAETPASVPLTFFLFFDSAAARGRSSPMLAVQRDVRRYVFERTLDSSGVGLLCDHIATADAEHLNSRSPARADYRALVRSLTDDLRGEINKVAKLASKATVLASPVLDPESPSWARVRQQLQPWVERDRWTGPLAIIARESLAVVAERRVVFDQGNQPLIDVTSRLRDLAEIHSHDSYFDRAKAFETLESSRDANPRGYVRSADDRSDLRLQIADVAAGMARTIIARHGYRELLNRFRCVLYNRRPLTFDFAVTLDEQIADHRKLVAAAIKRLVR